MNKIKSLGILIAFFLSCALPAVSFAQIPKQGKFEVIGAFQVTVIETQKFGEHTMSYIKGDGINLNKSGSGFMHNTSTSCMLVGIPGAFHGFCTTIDLDGDYIFHHNFLEKDFVVGTSGGGRRMVFVGGTGKYKGIQGGAPYEFTYAPKLEGKLLGQSAVTGEYKIP